MPDPRASSRPILVINSGSSSLKAALFVASDSKQDQQDERLVLQANATGIGQTAGKLSMEDGAGKPLEAEGETSATDQHDYHSQPEALEAIARSLGQHADQAPSAIGHRIVHGGMHLTKHQPLTPSVLEQLEWATHFAPLHIPGSLDLIRKAEQLYPGVPQFACFDTAFHQTLPEAAWRLPIPRSYSEQGVRRYGFHGLSYESILSQLQRESSPLPERIVVAHLGSGSSVCAILRGRSVDTSMGFTPSGGIPMATRTGDLDPGVLIYIMRTGFAGPSQSTSSGLTLDQAEELINHQCGLVAISGGVSDMQKLQTAAADLSNPHAAADAALAIDIFATAIAKTIASYIVSLAGLDLLVFTGGIGEHSPSLRALVAERLRPFGVRIHASVDPGVSVISTFSSQLLVRTLPAQEDLQIARHVRSMMTLKG